MQFDMKCLIMAIFPIITFAQVNNKEIQENFTNTLNTYRLANGLTPVKINLDVQESAKIQSDYLVSTLAKKPEGGIKYLCGHIHPLYPNPSDRLAEINPDLEESCLVYENAATAFLDTPTSTIIADKLFELWKSSTLHNQNLLAEVDAIGLAVSYNSITIIFPGFEDQPYTYNLYSGVLVLIKNQ
jgi:uncharacterized protein YkwD